MGEVSAVAQNRGQEVAVAAAVRGSWGRTWAGTAEVDGAQTPSVLRCCAPCEGQSLSSRSPWPPAGHSPHTGFLPERCRHGTSTGKGTETKVTVQPEDPPQTLRASGVLATTLRDLSPGGLLALVPRPRE